jgi:hypothetical protein
MIEYKSNKAEFFWFLTGYRFIGIGFNMFEYKSNKAEFFCMVPYWLQFYW